MRHQFKKIFSYQWDMAGDSFNSAHSIFKCQICGQEFTHWYHQEPSIYEAMEKVGIKINECPGAIAGMRAKEEK